MAQETLFKLYSPVLKNMRVQAQTALFNNILLPSVCSCLGRGPGLLSSDLLHPSTGRHRGKQQQQQLARVQAVPPGCAGLACGAQPLQGLSSIRSCWGRGAKLSAGPPYSQTQQHSSTQLLTCKEPGPKGCQGVPQLSLVCWVSSLQWLSLSEGLPRPTLWPLQLLAHTASTCEGLPRSTSTVQGTAPGAALSQAMASSSRWCLTLLLTETVSGSSISIFMAHVTL